jgi:hypothetical protein
MNTEAFKKAYSESRNGANFFVRHPLVRIFHYSDGVQECAEAGMYWLLDVVATECLRPLREGGEPCSILAVTVINGKAHMALSTEDDAPAIWQKDIEWTDMPDGTWTFELVDEGERFALILITEH